MASVEKKLYETGCILELLKVIARYFPNSECSVSRGDIHNDITVISGNKTFCLSLSHFSKDNAATLSLSTFSSEGEVVLHKEVIDTFFIHTKVKEAIEKAFLENN